MKKPFLILLLIALYPIPAISSSKPQINNINPNHFSGSDIQKIQAAVDEAAKTNGKVVIPSNNSNGSGVWLIDSAILLPSNMTVILDNSTIQLSDKSRDNMFRSNNVGIGISDTVWNQNISIIGVGEVYLKGANNPRATGDSGKTLSLDPVKDSRETGNWRISYGTDSGKEGEKQTGDWRNIMILMAYVDGFKLKNVNIENTHAWAVSHERVLNADISNIRINNPLNSIIKGKEQRILNRDGINLRHGCKNFRIDNISGRTGDDFVALSTLGIYSEDSEDGTLNSTMVTSREWRGIEDDTENIYISNIVCESSTRAVAIRANDAVSINNVYINGVTFKGGHNAMLVGGRGYGRESQPGKINNIHAMNIVGDGKSLIQIEEAIANCSFMNGVYTGDGEYIIIYEIDKSETDNIIAHNLIRIKK